MARVKLNGILTALNGHLGDEVFYTIGKKVYVRKYVKPHNPDSEAQQAHRSLFTEGMASWKLLDSDEQLIYKNRARKLGIHGHNLFIREYIKSMKLEKGKEIKSPQLSEALSQPQIETETKELRSSSVPTLYSLRRSFDYPYIQSIYSLYTPPV